VGNLSLLNVSWSFLVLEFLCVDENKPGKIAWMMRSALWMALGTRCSGYGGGEGGVMLI